MPREFDDHVINSNNRGSRPLVQIKYLVHVFILNLQAISQMV